MTMLPKTGFYWDDLAIGDVFKAPGITVTEEAIIRYASQWDMQPFHVDRDAAEETLFGGLVASGLQTLNLTYLMYLQTGLLAGTALAGLGIDEVRFFRPVRPGDTLAVDITVHSKRESSRRDRGIMTLMMRSSVKLEPCFSMLLTALVSRRASDGHGGNDDGPDRDDPPGLVKA